MGLRPGLGGDSLYAGQDGPAGGDLQRQTECLGTSLYVAPNVRPEKAVTVPAVDI